MIRVVDGAAVVAGLVAGVLLARSGDPEASDRNQGERATLPLRSVPGPRVFEPGDYRPGEEQGSRSETTEAPAPAVKPFLDSALHGRLPFETVTRLAQQNPRGALALLERLLQGELGPSRDRVDWAPVHSLPLTDRLLHRLGVSPAKWQRFDALAESCWGRPHGLLLYLGGDRPDLVPETRRRDRLRGAILQLASDWRAAGSLRAKGSVRQTLAAVTWIVDQDPSLRVAAIADALARQERLLRSDGAPADLAKGCRENAKRIRRHLEAEWR